MNKLVNTVTATEAKNRFGAILRRAYANAEHVIIERDGIAVAAPIPIQDYEQLSESDELAIQAEASASRDRLRGFLEGMEAQQIDYPAQEVEADIAQAVEAVRQANKID